MKFTLLIDINEDAPARIDDNMRYNRDYDTGFASLTAPNRETARALINEAMSTLQGMKESQKDDDTTPLDIANAKLLAKELQAKCDKIRDYTKNYPETPKGKRVTSQIEKGRELINKNKRSGLWSDEAIYLHYVDLLDPYDGISNTYYLALYRGVCLEKRRAKSADKRAAEADIRAQHQIKNVR